VLRVYSCRKREVNLKVLKVPEIEQKVGSRLAQILALSLCKKIPLYVMES
jgi:hypothetical protein